MEKNNSYECMLCLENTPPLYKTCNCNSLLHKECFEKMVNKIPSHNKSCAVCKKPYNVEILNTNYKCTYIRNSCIYFFVWYGLCASISTGTTIIFIYYYNYEINKTNFLLLIIFLYILSFGFPIVGHIYFNNRVQHICCFYREKIQNRNLIIDINTQVQVVQEENSESNLIITRTND